MVTQNKILLYDDYCPLCTWYSGLFTRCGLLNPSNRIPFSKAGIELLESIDIDKAKDEIPLYDPATKEVLYGIDALLDILAQKCSLIKTIGSFTPVYWFLKKLYKLISYNRKVIVAKKCGEGAFDCSPAFNVRYRVFFLITFLIVNSIMLFPIHDHLLVKLPFYHQSIGGLQSGHVAFVAINCLLAARLPRHTALEYLGQVNVLALLCILLLSILTLICVVIPVPGWLLSLPLVVITLFIVKEYFRRMYYVGIIDRYREVVVINIACLSAFLTYVLFF